MSNFEDQVKLAKAMGWRENVYPESAGWWTHDELDLHRVGPPTPLTDANDDYAVLEWAREQGTKFIVLFRRQFFEMHRTHPWDYAIGDYARAVLRVINNDN
jgi:hypothetical protein